MATEDRTDKYGNLEKREREEGGTAVCGLRPSQLACRPSSLNPSYKVNPQLWHREENKRKSPPQLRSPTKRVQPLKLTHFCHHNEHWEAMLSNIAETGYPRAKAKAKTCSCSCSCLCLLHVHATAVRGWPGRRGRSILDGPPPHVQCKCTHPRAFFILKKRKKKDASCVMAIRVRVVRLAIGHWGQSAKGGAGCPCVCVGVCVLCA